VKTLVYLAEMRQLQKLKPQENTTKLNVHLLLPTPNFSDRDPVRRTSDEHIFAYWCSNFWEFGCSCAGVCCRISECL